MKHVASITYRDAAIVGLTIIVTMGLIATAYLKISQYKPTTNTNTIRHNLNLRRYFAIDQSKQGKCMFVIVAAYRVAEDGHGNWSKILDRFTDGVTRQEVRPWYTSQSYAPTEFESMEETYRIYSDVEKETIKKVARLHPHDFMKIGQRYSRVSISVIFFPGIERNNFSDESAEPTQFSSNSLVSKENLQLDRVELPPVYPSKLYGSSTLAQAFAYYYTCSRLNKDTGSASQTFNERKIIHSNIWITIAFSRYSYITAALLFSYCATSYMLRSFSK